MVDTMVDMFFSSDGEISIPVQRFFILVPMLQTEVWEDKCNLSSHILLRVCTQK